MFSVLRQTARSASAFRATCRAPAMAPRWSGSVRTLVTHKFTKDHELVKFDDELGVGTVTITEYAQKSLGDVVYIELPSVGTEVKKGDQIGAVESVKAASDIYAPVSGVIEAINDDLTDQPGLLNKSPQDKGWLCKIKVADSAELEELLNADAYKAHCES